MSEHPFFLSSLINNTDGAIDCITLAQRTKPNPDGICNATSNLRKDRCRARAVPYLAVCRFHGGSLERCKRASAYRKALDLSEKAARAFLARNGYGQVDDPVEALSQVAAEAVAMKDFFRSQIEELRYKAQTGEQLRAEVALYERALDRTLKALEIMAKLNISERRTKVAEAQAVLIAETIKNILGRLDLTPAQRLVAGTVVPEELRAITAVSASPIPEPEGKFSSAAD